MLLVLGVEVGVLFREELDHRHRAAAVHGAEQRRLAVLVRSVDVAAADFERQLHRFERLFGRARTFSRPVDADASRRHQRRRAVGGGDLRIGFAVKEHAHQRDVGRFRRHEERRAADAIQHVAIAVARLPGDARVHVGAARDKSPHQLEAVEIPGGNRPRHVEAAIRSSRPRHLVQRAPPLRRGVRVGAPFEQRRGQLVMRVVHRQYQRAHAVRQALVDVRAGIEQRARGVEVTAAHREEQRREHT